MIEYLKLIRPANCVMTAIAVYIGAVIAGAQLTEPVIFGMISAFLICAGGMAINDYFDVETDRINKKRRKRPVVKGAIKKSYALAVFVILSLVGLYVAFLISLDAFYIAFVVTVVLFVYTPALKRVVLLGNVAISLLVALSFIFGALIGGDILAVFYLALLAFLANMGREIYKDIEDVMGDKQVGKRTLAIRIGVIRAKDAASIFTLAAVALSFIPFFLTFNYTYLFFVVIADIVFITSILSTLNLRAKLSKVAMAIALIAFYIAAIQ